MSDRKDHLLERLVAGATSGSVACGDFLAAMDSLHRTTLYTKLLFERLERKMQLVESLHQEADRNWNQTFYLLYFRTLGDKTNQEAYLELARRVPYRILLRERTSPHGIEALLLGCSGLLDLYPDDQYTRTLRAEYAHYAAKYDLRTMPASKWVLHEIRPANHPVLRLAQAAVFFRQDELLFERVLYCDNETKVRNLFCIEADAYWRNHPVPGSHHEEEHPRRLGAFKANIIGINLVVILQYAYGALTGKEHLRERALSLLEALPAEDNRYMRLWRAEGVKPRDAFESQALLQLITEHCAGAACADCPLAHQILTTK